MGIDVKVDTVSGLKELDAFLADLPVEMQRKMLYSALMTGAGPIMKQAQDNVRRNFGASLRYTGTLEKGITRGRRKKTGLAARVDVKLKKPKESAKTVKTGAGGRRVTKKYGDDPFYGKFLELGTRDMPAKPWLRPAAELKQSEAGRKFQAALEKQVAKWCKAHGVTYKPGV